MALKLQEHQQKQVAILLMQRLLEKIQTVVIVLLQRLTRLM